MRLRDVQNVAQFEDFYKANNLQTNKQKIDFLINEMGIIASHGTENFTEEEEICSLQQLALHDWDRVSHTHLPVNAYKTMQIFLENLDECIKNPNDICFPCGDRHVGAIYWNKHQYDELYLNFHDDYVKIFIENKIHYTIQSSEIIEHGLPLPCLEYVLESKITARFINKVLANQDDFAEEAKKHFELGYISKRIYDKIIYLPFLS